ncbi:MAG: alpha/beta hydrolase [Bacteroidia bacterium]|nr:alpha/beta hydrolase [Bacteroidia bacterium]NND11000.1 alpha/beta hydrolase [Flavobacteriaceae bacterium]NNK28354.1 alpha/beta hydrolase [Flavobacteriaceae bacterium]RZV67165.1 MAG: alpha/beta hydrolase [Flavobacteriaceae bacterium]
MKSLIALLFLTISTVVFSQESNFFEQDVTIADSFSGTLLMPNTEKPPLVILLAGSGPLDKDGNTNFMKGDLLKKLAGKLGDAGIASFRYDKHSLRQIKKGKYDLDYSFDVFIEDASASLDHFKSKSQFGKIYILGHSQGSLVGMIAAQEKADGFISVAGPGQTIDEVVIYQINATSPNFTEDTKRVFSILKTGKTTDDFPPALASIFNKPTQPFMMSWMKYDPQEEIKKLDMPVLIINGTKDIQVIESEADLLHKASPDSKLVIIDKMNHVLVPIERDRLENVKSYNEPDREFSSELLEALLAFIK